MAIKKIDLKVIKSGRFTNWFWEIHRLRDYNRRDLLKIAYKDEPYVKVLLHYCYNTDVTYKGIKGLRIAVSDRTNAKGVPTTSQYRGKSLKSTYKKFCTILDDLLADKLTKDEAKADLYTLYCQCDRYTKWVYNRVLARNLQIGVTVFSLRELFPDLFGQKNIVKPEVITADELPSGAYYGVPVNLKRRAFLVSDEKYFKIVSIVGAGKPVEESFYAELPKKVVIDGYFLHEKEQVGTRLVRKKTWKKYRQVPVYKHTLKFYCIDYLPLVDFESRKCDIPLKERLQILKSLDIYTNTVVLAKPVVYTKDMDLSEYKKLGSHLLLRATNSQWGVDPYFCLSL